MFTLLHRAFKLCSSLKLLHHEIEKLKTNFGKNSYPKSFVDFCVKKYLDKVFYKKKELVLNAPKKELICVLPFIGKKSLQLRNRLINSIVTNIKLWKIKVIFQSPYKLVSSFRFKDPLRKVSTLTLFTDSPAVTGYVLW